MASKASRTSLRKMRGGRRVFRGSNGGKFSVPNVAIPNVAIPNVVIPNFAIPNFAIPNVAIDSKALRLATKGSERLPLMDQRAVDAADEALKVVDGVLEERKDEAKSFKR